MSIFPGAYPRFNWTSFYTTTKACPIYISYVSDDIYDYHGSNDVKVTTEYYHNPTGIDEIKPYDYEGAVNSLAGPAESGNITDLEYEIVSLDGENPNVYKFKI